MQKGEKVITQLDTKSVYTFMESLVTIKDYVQVAKSMGYGALGIMDVDNLYGAYEFIEACQARNLSPLVGLEIGLKVDNETIPFRMIALSTKGLSESDEDVDRQNDGEKQLGRCEAPHRRSSGHCPSAFC